MHAQESRVNQRRCDWVRLVIMHVRWEKFTRSTLIWSLNLFFFLHIINILLHHSTSAMRATLELVKIWTEALVPVCNHSQSHASQELKWLMQHAKQVAHIQEQQLKATNASNIVAGQRGRGTLSPYEIELLQSYVDQRVKTRKPLQYILGTQPFMDLEILTRPPTLIPRCQRRLLRI